MAALHSALTALAPTSDPEVFSSSADDAKAYLQSIFRSSQIILDSVPPPLVSETSTAAATPTPRPRSSTVTSSASSVSASSARSDLIDGANANLQKEWGKPIKLAAKDNPYNIAVYKLSGKDGKGAWFARRSVHEGMGFRKWKIGLQREFPESLAVQGGPGEGNVRGIGAERKVCSRVVEAIGQAEVYHLSAQFPGPTTPRDFVELLLTSDAAIDKSTEGRHYMVVSKPCQHPECPQRDGFVRGQYESVEFIREIPKQKPRRSMSAADLRRVALSQPPLPEDHLASSTPSGESLAASPTGRARGHTISFAESRGTEAKGESLDHPTDGDDDELNPVEWIMITRSDPGGSVPRFMVERGTPGSIVADAGKWLEWARTKDHGVDERENLDTIHSNGHLAGLEEDEIGETGEEKVAREGDGAGAATLSRDVEPFPSIDEPPVPLTGPSKVSDAEGSSLSLVSSAIDKARSSLEPYTPKIVINHLPRQPSPLQKSTSNLEDRGIDDEAETGSDSDSSISSGGSFVSVGDRFEGEEEAKSITDATSSSHKASEETDGQAVEGAEKEIVEAPELAKIRQRRKTLDHKFQQLRRKEIEKVLKEKGQSPLRSASRSESSGKDSPRPDAAVRTAASDNLTITVEQSSSTDTTEPDNSSSNTIPHLDPETAKTVESRLSKAQQKHTKDLLKQDAKYQQTISKLSQKREKDLAKQAARRSRVESKDRETTLVKENEALKKSLAGAKEQVETLVEQVGALQRENTALVARLGKLDGGGAALWELRQELLLSPTGGGGGSNSGGGDVGGGGGKKSTRSRSSTGTGSRV